MRIPRSVVVGGRKIKVEIVDVVDSNDPKCVGLADYTNGLILIKKKMKRSAQEAVFIHELFHHCNSSMHHGLLDSLAEQVYQVFKVNKLWR